MGVWKPNSSRFILFVVNYRCRGTLRARIVAYCRSDRQDIAERLEKFVGHFMERYEARVVALYDEK